MNVNKVQEAKTQWNQYPLADANPKLLLNQTSSSFLVPWLDPFRWHVQKEWYIGIKHALCVKRLFRRITALKDEISAQCHPSSYVQSLCFLSCGLIHWWSELLYKPILQAVCSWLLTKWRMLRVSSSACRLRTTLPVFAWIKCLSTGIANYE